jgi:hypothetical protein
VGIYDRTTPKQDEAGQTGTEIHLSPVAVHVVSVKQAAARVGVSEKTMLRWVSGGAVVAFRHGRWGHWYVRVDEHGWPLRANPYPEASR